MKVYTVKNRKVAIRSRTKFRVSSSRPKGWRETKKERIKSLILKAALDLFQTRGFDKTTTKTIAKRAKVAEGTIFNYFKTKEDLALYFFEKEIEYVINYCHNDKRFKILPIEEKLFTIIQKILEYITPYENFICQVFFRSLSPSSKLNPFSIDSQELTLNWLKFIREILRESEAKGEIPNLGDYGAYAFCLFYIGILMYWSQDRSKNKENTLALVDRSLKLALSLLQRRKWQW